MIRPPVTAATQTLVATIIIGIVAGCGVSRAETTPSPTSSSALPSPTVRPSPSMNPTQASSVSPETQVVMPFGPDSFTFTFDAPASWEPYEGLGVWIDDNAPPDGAALFIYDGADVGLYSDPCLPEDGDPDIAVGPTVDDLVTALVDHPSLEVTSPADVTLAGYSGMYLDLLVPDDISACAFYRPMGGHIYAQGPGHRWHLWVLGVGGARVLVETNDYAGTPAQRLAEEQAMIDSLEVTP